MTRSVLGAALVVLALVATDTYLARCDDTLPKELRQLEQLRKGKDTPLDEVERRGRELLKEHASPEEQGQIYYHLVNVHGQSGMAHPELVVEYAKHALQCPLEPGQRLRLYVYWGDALMIGNMHAANESKKPFPEIRKLAVVPYLEGLKDAQKYNIPQHRPKMPMAELFDVSPPNPDYERIQDEQIAAQKRARIEQELWDHRRILTGQIVYMYARKPHAATELRQLATKILEAPATVDSLMKLIEEKGGLSDDPIEKN